MSAALPKKGEYVHIYQKPITEDDFEGVARVVRSGNPDSDSVVTLQVAFKNDAGPYTRRVLLPAKMSWEF